MAVEQKAGLDARVEAAKALTRHIIGWGDAEAQAQLQNAPNRSKDLELAEAQAKLEAAVGLLKEARQAYEGHGVGDPAVCDDCAFVARIDALLASVEEGGES